MAAVEEPAARVVAGRNRHGRRTQGAPWAWFSADVALATLTLNVLSLAAPIVILQVYDRVIPNHTTDTLVLLVLGAGCALILDALIRRSRAFLAGMTAAGLQHGMACGAFERFLGADLARVEGDVAMVHLERLVAPEVLGDFHAGQATMVVIDLPFALLFLGFIAYLGGWLVLAPLALLLFLGAAALAAGRRLHAANGSRATADDRRFSYVIEVLGGIHTVKALGMEALMARRYERLQEASARATYAVNLYSARGQALGASFYQATMVVVGALGGLLVIDGTLTAGALAACMLLAGRSQQPLLRAVGTWAQFQNIRVARERLAQAMRLLPEARAALPPAPPLSGAIELDRVSFRYPGADRYVLDGLSLRVAPGEAIGITGESGSGTSTLLQLVAGTLHPSEGRVRFGAANPAHYEPRSIRRQIRYLPQRPVLFRGTIEDNLALFARDQRQDAAREAARALGLDDVVASLPQGYATRVGEAASDPLPPGLRQWIALARGLAVAAPIVLFDEANTELDSAADERLKEQLRHLKGRCTLVLVSHRPSLLSLADRTYQLRDGSLHLLTAAWRPGATARAEHPAT